MPLWGKQILSPVLHSEIYRSTCCKDVLCGCSCNSDKKPRTQILAHFTLPHAVHWQSATSDLLPLPTWNVSHTNVNITANYFAGMMARDEKLVWESPTATPLTSFNIWPWGSLIFCVLPRVSFLQLISPGAGLPFFSELSSVCFKAAPLLTWTKIFLLYRLAYLWSRVQKRM